MKRTLMIFVIFVACSKIGVAQDSTHTPPETTTLDNEKLEELHLTNQQKEQLKKLVVEEKIKLQQIHVQQQKKIEAILNKEQLNRLRTWRQRRPMQPHRL
jgi:Spy/CpxP family protein refolding chaperone